MVAFGLRSILAHGEAMTEELKPCPFCGSKIVGLISGEWGAVVNCGGCLAEGPIAMDDESAAIAWNKAIRETKE